MAAYYYEVFHFLTRQYSQCQQQMYQWHSTRQYSQFQQQTYWRHSTLTFGHPLQSLYLKNHKPV